MLPKLNWCDRFLSDINKYHFFRYPSLHKVDILYCVLVSSNDLDCFIKVVSVRVSTTCDKIKDFCIK